MVDYSKESFGGFTEPLQFKGVCVFEQPIRRPVSHFAA